MCRQNLISAQPLRFGFGEILAKTARSVTVSRGYLELNLLDELTAQARRVERLAARLQELGVRVCLADVSLRRGRTRQQSRPRATLHCFTRDVRRAFARFLLAVVPCRVSDAC